MVGANVINLSFTNLTYLVDLANSGCGDAKNMLVSHARMRGCKVRVQTVTSWEVLRTSIIRKQGVGGVAKDQFGVDGGILLQEAEKAGIKGLTYRILRAIVKAEEQCINITGMDGQKRPRLVVKSKDCCCIQLALHELYKGKNPRYKKPKSLLGKKAVWIHLNGASTAKTPVRPKWYKHLIVIWKLQKHVRREFGTVKTRRRKKV